MFRIRVNAPTISDKNLMSLNTMTSTIEELKSKLKNAEGTIKDKMNEVSKTNAEVEKSQTQIAELNATISSIKEERTRNNNELKNAQEVISQKQSKINELSETKTVLENSVKSLETQLTNLNEELDKRENLRTEAEVKIKESESSKEKEMVRKAKANAGIAPFGEKKQDTLIELQDSRTYGSDHAKQQQEQLQEQMNLRMLEEQEASIKQLEVNTSKIIKNSYMQNHLIITSFIAFAE